MKQLLPVLLLPFALFADTVTMDDLRKLEGQWQGTLTYLDYQSGKKYSLPVEISAAENKAAASEFLLFYVYPNEPKANTTDTLRLQNEGRYIDDQKVLSKRKRGDRLEIRTEKEGEDDNRPATLLYTLTVSNKELSLKKEVRFAGERQLVLRNEYKLRRVLNL